MRTACSLAVLTALGVALAFVAGRAAAGDGDLTTTRAAPRTPIAPIYEPGRLEVRFAPRATPQQIATVLRHDAVRTVLAIPDIAVRIVETDPARVQEAEAELRTSPIVVHVERDEEVEAFRAPNDKDYGEQWGIRTANFPAAWRLISSRIVRVAVVDSGVESSIPELAGRVVDSLEIVPGGGDPNGHGTAIAGIIAARTGNVHGGVGACPVCRIISVRVLDAKARGDSGITADGIVRAVDLHARVINVSLGGAAPFDALEQAVRYAAAKGALVVAAAGNDGTLAPYWPARYPGVLSVAASTQGDALYTWSQRGSWVQVTAPGCNVAPEPDGRTEEFCGTSSATPLVSAEAAMLFAARPKATPAQVAGVILATSRRIRGVARGRIDAGRAVRAVRR